LNSAHRAVEKKAGWMDFGWIHGLTTAAVVVLALSIILTQRQPVPPEESGFSPADQTSPDRVRNSESLLLESRTEQSETEPESREVLSLEYNLLSRKDGIQPAPAASALEEDMLQANEPAKAIAAKRAVTTTTDESAAAGPAPALAGQVKIDADSAIADKFEAEQSQLSAEELLLQAILLLKRDGNDSWKTELQSFIESYPDYPLPDELQN